MTAAGIVIFSVLLAAIGWLLKRWFNSLEQSDKRIETKVDKIDEKVSKIDNRVFGIETKFNIGYTTTHSPIRLTSKGVEVLTESGAKAIFDKEDVKKAILNKILAEPKPTNAYDAQEKIKQVIKSMANDPMMIPIKNYAFQKGIELDVMLTIISIYCRDIVLEKLGFKTEDLDKQSKENQNVHTQ